MTGSPLHPAHLAAFGALALAFAALRRSRRALATQAAAARANVEAAWCHVSPGHSPAYCPPDQTGTALVVNRGRPTGPSFYSGPADTIPTSPSRPPPYTPDSPY